MSLFPIPVSVAARLERLQLDFLWGWDWGLGKFLSTKLAQDLYFDKVKWVRSSKFDSAQSSFVGKMVVEVCFGKGGLMEIGD